jgi:hypothetical protein
MRRATPSYLAEHADYGWASTIDGAQGATADIGILLARTGVLLVMSVHLGGCAHSVVDTLRVVSELPELYVGSGRGLVPAVPVLVGSHHPERTRCGGFTGPKVY